MKRNQVTHPEPPPATVLDDWDLVTRVRTGDREAYGVLYERHVDQVFRYALFRTRDRGLAEDITSETFVRVLRMVGRLTDLGRPFPTVLITVARNLVFDHHKSCYHRLCKQTSEIRDDNVIIGEQRVVDPADSVTGRDTQHRLSEHLRVLISGLTESQQECIRLRFFTGLSVDDTAMVMGKDPGAVKQTQRRAVRSLARRLPVEARELSRA